MSYTIAPSVIFFCSLLSCTIADLKSRKLRSLLSSTSATSSVHEILPSDGNFEYRISYQDYKNGAEYAIYSPPGQTHEQQWFHGANLFNEIKTSTDNTFGITVDNYCLYHSYVSNEALMDQVRTFYWFDCTYNPSQTLEKRIATHYYRGDAAAEFRVFFSFDNPQSNNDRIYEKITLSIKTITTDNHESVAQIPVYFVHKKTDMKIEEATSQLDLFPWEVAPFEDQYWKYQIMFDKPMTQTLGDNNASNSNHLVMPLTVLIQFLQRFVYIIFSVCLTFDVF